MRVGIQSGRLMLLAACGAARAFVPSPAMAQGREAAITVRATVRGIDESTVLGAHALAAAPSRRPIDATPSGAAWRITSGRRVSLGIQVDGTAAVTICERASGAAERCEPHRGGHVESVRGGEYAELVLRLDRQARGGVRAAESVRLTLAFVDF